MQDTKSPEAIQASLGKPGEGLPRLTAFHFRLVSHPFFNIAFA